MKRLVQLMGPLEIQTMVDEIKNPRLPNIRVAGQIQIVVFDNGMVAVFDKQGQEIPDLQGHAAISATRIARWIMRQVYGGDPTE